MGVLCVLTLDLLLLPGAGANPPRAKQEDPSGPQGLALANSLLMRKQFKEAIKAYKHENALERKQSADCYWGMASAYWGLKDFKKVEENCDRALQYSSANSPLQGLAHNLNGLAAEQRGLTGDRKEFAKAEDEFQAAYKASLGTPNDAIILFNLGVTQLQDHQDARGIATLSAYLAKVPQGLTADRARRVIADPKLASLPAAPDFTLTALDGRSYSLAGLRGKIVLLDFWATWCPPCQEAIPSLISLDKKFSSPSFVMISVSVDTDDKAWRKFIQKHEMDWPQYRDNNGSLGRTFGIDAVPTCFLIDQDGVVLYRDSGWGNGSEMILAANIAKELKMLAKDTAQSNP